MAESKKLDWFSWCKSILWYHKPGYSRIFFYYDVTDDWW